MAAKRGRPSSGWKEESKKKLQSLRLSLRNWSKKAPRGYIYTGPKGGKITMKDITEKEVLYIYSLGSLNRLRAEELGFIQKIPPLTVPKEWTSKLKKRVEELYAEELQKYVDGLDDSKGVDLVSIKTVTKEAIDVADYFSQYLSKVGTKIYKSENIRRERIAEANMNMEDVFNAIADAAKDPQALKAFFEKIRLSLDSLSDSEKYRAIYDEKYTREDLID